MSNFPSTNRLASKLKLRKKNFCILFIWHSYTLVFRVHIHSCLQLLGASPLDPTGALPPDPARDLPHTPFLSLYSKFLARGGGQLSSRSSSPLSFDQVRKAGLRITAKWALKGQSPACWEFLRWSCGKQRISHRFSRQGPHRHKLFPATYMRR